MTTQIILLAMLSLVAGCVETQRRSSRELPRPAGEDGENGGVDDGTSASKKKKNEKKPRQPTDDGGPDDAEDDGEGDDAADSDGDDATGGKGGATGRVERRSAGGLSYWIDAPQDAAEATGEPFGLLVLLHGSGASNYENFVRDMQAVATAKRLVPVSVLAPNGGGWNEGGEERAADLLHELVQKDLYPKYNVDRRRVVFSGQSSGGGFLSSHFVPMHAQDYRGGAFMQCGAAPPDVPFAPDEATRKGFRLHFEITSGDPIWPASYRRALDAYAKAGMQLTKDDTKRGGHCAFDQAEVILTHLAEVLGTP